MPECYLLALAQSSSLDAETNNFSLFGLIEEVAVPGPNAFLPLEFHAYWKFAPEELNVAFEIRLRLTDGKTDHPSPVTSLQSSTARLRGRGAGLRIPGPGQWNLLADWRLPDGEWTAGTIRWPLTVKTTQTQGPDNSQPAS